MRTPRASIIVLCFNGLAEATRPCIESIYRNTPISDFELVVVDNASTDGTPDYIRQVEKTYPNVIIQLNDVNKGYAAGNNDGLKLAKGAYLVLLNNDTLVPPGWLDHLLSPLESDEGMGMVGPVTNSAGNEQRVNIEGLVESNYEEIAIRYTTRNHGACFETQRLGFFCVALRRELIEKVGLLDENFGMGMFEDDDYCVRTLSHGYKLTVTEGCYVYHKGSVSFSKLQHAEYHALFQRNRRYFIDKHHMDWALSDIAFAYLNKFKRDLEEYSSRNEIAPVEIERVTARIDNFRHLLVQVREAELRAQADGYSPRAGESRWSKYRRRFKTVQKELIFGSAQQRTKFITRIVTFYYSFWIEKLGVRKARELRILSELVSYQKGRQVIIFPATVDFGYMTQRPQHLATAFSKAGYFVLYGTLNHSIDKVKYIEKKSDSLFLINQHYLQRLREIFRKEDCVYYCLWPTNLMHTAYLPYDKLIYDYMDELELLDMDQRLAERNHRDLLQRADVITASSSALYDKIPPNYHEKTLLVPNAVSSEFLDRIQSCQQVNEEIGRLKLGGKVIVGYYGAIAPWFDFDLIAYLATKNQRHEYVFIGPVFEVDSQVEDLRSAHSNVHFLPMVEHEGLAEYLIGFDVAIIPFIKNHITDAVSPLKLFEYMAAGKPVVTTDLNECRNFPYGVYRAKSKEEFAALLDSAISEWNDNSRERQLNLALENRWEKRVHQIMERLGHRRDDSRMLDEIAAIQGEISTIMAEEHHHAAQHYATAYSRQELQYWKPVIAWIGCLPTCESVLDIGPAYGTLLLYAAKKFRPKYLCAIDAIEYLSKALVDRYCIDYRKLDIERSESLPEVKFNLIIFTEVIEHLNYGPVQTLRRLSTMLAPGGRMVLTTPDAAEWGKIKTYYTAWREIPTYVDQEAQWIDAHIWQYDKDEIEDVIREAGLTIRAFEYAPGVSGRHLCYCLEKEANDINQLRTITL